MEIDIHKEREAFDEYFKEKYPELYKDVFNEDGDERAIIGYSFALSAWQARAKAQAVPEGFVLVKTSDIAKLAIAVSRVDLMTYSEERPDNEKLAWQNVANKLKAMIEPQESK
jgi:hypothetical protein